MAWGLPDWESVKLETVDQGLCCGARNPIETGASQYEKLKELILGDFGVSLGARR
jgi:hypothetical protein